MRHRQRWQKIDQRFHHFLLAIDAIQIAEPSVTCAELRPRLFENEAISRGLDAQHEVRDAARKRFDAHRTWPDPLPRAQVILNIVHVDFEHDSAAGRRQRRVSPPWGGALRRGIPLPRTTYGY